MCLIPCTTIFGVEIFAGRAYVTEISASRPGIVSPRFLPPSLSLSVVRASAATVMPRNDSLRSFSLPFSSPVGVGGSCSRSCTAPARCALSRCCRKGRSPPARSVPPSPWGVDRPSLRSNQPSSRFAEPSVVSRTKTDATISRSGRFENILCATPREETVARAKKNPQLFSPQTNSPPGRGKIR